MFFPKGSNVTSGAGIVGAIETLQKNLTTYLSNPTLESEANIVKSSFSSITQILKSRIPSLIQFTTVSSQTLIRRSAAQTGF